MNDSATLIAPATMRLERLLPGPVERVWAYLTESEKRATWLCGGEFELRVGGRVQLEFDHDRLSSEKATPEKHKGAEHARFEGRITRLEPLRACVHMDERATRVSVMSGWDVHTGILTDVLNGNAPRPFWSTHARLEREYEARA